MWSTGSDLFVKTSIHLNENNKRQKEKREKYEK